MPKPHKTTPPDDGLFDDPEPAPPVWTDLPPRVAAEPPYDGAPVWVRGLDAAGVERFGEAVWHATRKMNYKTLRWEPTGFWVPRNAAGQRLGFEPTHYVKT